jgi:hypothetical protein
MRRPSPIRQFFLVLLALLICGVAANIEAQRSSRKQRSPSAPVHKFATSSSAEGIKFELINNLVLVQARVNNSEPLWFIFDTGATNTVVDTKQAEALRLKARGKTSGTGSAANLEAGRFPNVSIQFPGFEVSRLTVYSLPVEAFSPVFGLPVAGVIGNDIIGRITVEIDYAQQKLNFYETSSYRPTGTGDVFPVTFQDRLPMVQGRFELAGHDFSGIFEIDTGSTGAIQINEPFVRRNRLLSLLTKSRKENLGGVGGTAESIVARLQSFSVGQYRFMNPIASLSQAKQGDYASRRYDGLLGGKIFRRFKLIVDLGHSKITFEPNGALNEAFEGDMSGLELVGDDPNFSTYTIDDIEPDSPAVAAGIKGGETLLAIDGRTASDFLLDEIRRMFMYDGREYDLTLKRDAETIHVKLKLRRLI